MIKSNNANLLLYDTSTEQNAKKKSYMKQITLEPTNLSKVNILVIKELIFMSNKGVLQTCSRIITHQKWSLT